MHIPSRVSLLSEFLDLKCYTISCKLIKTLSKYIETPKIAAKKFGGYFRFLYLCSININRNIIRIMAKIGYARVSTKDQNLDLQLEALKEVGCEKVFSEKKSGLRERPQLEAALAYLRPGDIFVVYKFDRIGRSLKDLLNIVSSIHERGIQIQSLKDNIDVCESNIADAKENEQEQENLDDEEEQN